MKHQRCEFYFLIVHLFFKEIKQTFSVQVLRVDVPQQVKLGSQASLGCQFDLQGKSLYSLNWWKDHQQFYQFSPSVVGMKQIHDTHGIEVVVSESNLRTVSLRNVSKATSGEFKCEVVADFPSYERDSLSAAMQVIEVPIAAPIISVGRIHYRVGDVLEANCSSPGSNPPPTLSWHINGKDIPSKGSIIFSKSEEKKYVVVENSSLWDNTSNGERESNPVTDDVRVPVTSTIIILMQPIHFRNEGRATLTCVASISNIYLSSTSIQLTLPGIKPIELSLQASSAQMKTICSSLKFYLALILVLNQSQYILTSIQNSNFLLIVGSPFSISGSS